MVFTLYTHLRVPYDVCVKHITKNLRKKLNVKIISPKVPDVINTVSLDEISLNIRNMEEKDCKSHDCIEGTLYYKDELYTFKTHHNSYDAILIMKKTRYPFDTFKMILPITTYHNKNTENNENNTKIYIPEEYTTDNKIIPVEFVWEFLSQLPNCIKIEDEQ